MNWLQYFVNIAEQVKLRSKDQRRQIGVVVIGPDNAIRTTGYNSFPRGIDDSKQERQEKPEKFYFFAHAERNAIYSAAKTGVSLDGCTMIMTCGLPCADCAIAIIQSGIKKLWVNKDEQAGNNAMWIESTARSMQMFEEAGVEVWWWSYSNLEQQSHI